MDTEGMIAVVSGAAQGIGKATIDRFVRNGHTAVGVDVKGEEGALLGKVTSGAGRSAHFRCDVSDEGQVEAMVAKVIARYGRIDVLVNNAGLVQTKALTEASWDDFRRIFDINVGGQFLLCKHIVPVMKNSRRAAIVNVASVSGHVGSVNNVLYCASKGAVLAFTKALAVELAPYGIRVNSVSPGYIDTAMLRGELAMQAEMAGLTPEEVLLREEAAQLFRRFASPSEVAEAIYFLATESASFITGSDLLVDCGWVAK